MTTTTDEVGVVPKETCLDSQSRRSPNSLNPFQGDMSTQNMNHAMTDMGMYVRLCAKKTIFFLF